MLHRALLVLIQSGLSVCVYVYWQQKRKKERKNRRQHVLHARVCAYLHVWCFDWWWYVVWLLTNILQHYSIKLTFIQPTTNLNARILKWFHFFFPGHPMSLSWSASAACQHSAFATETDGLSSIENKKNHKEIEIFVWLTASRFAQLQLYRSRYFFLTLLTDLFTHLVCIFTFSSHHSQLTPWHRSIF